MCVHVCVLMCMCVFMVHILSRSSKHVNIRQQKWANTITFKEKFLSTPMNKWFCFFIAPGFYIVGVFTAGHSQDITSSNKQWSIRRPPKITETEIWSLLFLGILEVDHYLFNYNIFNPGSRWTLICKLLLFLESRKASKQRAQSSPVSQAGWLQWKRANSDHVGFGWRSFVRIAKI